jgi:hypothetical protein
LEESLEVSQPQHVGGRDLSAHVLADGRRSRAAGALAMLLAGAVATVASVLLVAGSDVLTHPHSNATARGLAIALCTGVGAYTWWLRPESR